MNFLIRKVRLADAPDLRGINSNSLGYEYSADNTAANLKIILENSNNALYVAVADNRVVGYIHGCNYDVMYTPRVKNILGFAVDREYQNRGVGTALLKAMEQWAKDTGASGIRLNSGTARINAHRFYESRGYSCDKSQLRFIKYFDETIR